MGTLTAALAEAVARVWAIEVDPELAGRLRRRFERAPGVSVLEADATRVDWPAEPFAVVANLPFAGAAGILRSLLDDPCVPLTRADVIVQWEMAVKRARLWPSTLASVFWGAWYEFSVVRRLPPSAFSPPPAAAAGVLRIERRAEPLVPVRESRAYGAFVRSAFNGRRMVSGRRAKRLADELGFSRTAAPRDLDPHHSAALYCLVRAGR